MPYLRSLPADGLAAAAQVLLDETVMVSGRLEAGGVDALRALRHLMTAKAVDYDFQYYVLPQPADAPVTVGSEYSVSSESRRWRFHEQWWTYLNQAILSILAWGRDAGLVLQLVPV